MAAQASPSQRSDHSVADEWQNIGSEWALGSSQPGPLYQEVVALNRNARLV